MPKKKHNQIIYSAKESQTETCPICGGDLDYGALEVDDSHAFYPWECHVCCTSGNEIVNLTFEGHRVDIESLPLAEKRVYKDFDGNLYFVREGTTRELFKGYRRLLNPRKGQRRESGLRELSYTPVLNQAQYELDEYADLNDLIEVITPKSPLTLGRVVTFEVVSKIPAGFLVWNIGDNMGSDEYIPLCQMLNTGMCDINTDTLKAIKLDKSDVMILREAAHYGVTSKKDAISALKRPAKSSMQKKKKQLSEKALPIFEKITA